MENLRNLVQAFIRITGNLQGTPEQRHRILLDALEREQAKYIGKDESAVAYFENLLAQMRQRGHICEYTADNEYKCRVCGELL